MIFVHPHGRESAGKATRPSTTSIIIPSIMEALVCSMLLGSACSTLHAIMVFSASKRVSSKKQFEYEDGGF